MVEVEILRGFPASGKSTYARTSGKLRINKDDLRDMLHNGHYSRENEKEVLWVRDIILKEALRRGRDVVIDDTNLNPVHISAVRKIAAGHDVKILDHFLDVPYEELLVRDERRAVLGGGSVGKAVIDRMQKQWKTWKDQEPTVPEIPAWKPVTNVGDYDAWIVDIDGTLADHTGIRSPYEFWKVGQDRPIRPTCRLVHEFLKAGGRVFFFSGRDDSCFADTFDWLSKNVDWPNIEDTGEGVWTNWSLHMRKTGDKRKDDIVKSEMFDEIVEPSDYEVSIVIDDRKQVKRMWVARGLFVLDVNQTDEEF